MKYDVETKASNFTLLDMLFPSESLSAISSSMDVIEVAREGKARTNTHIAL